MKYSYREGVEKPKSRKWVVLPIFLVLAIVYGALNYLSPAILYVVEPADTTAKTLIANKPQQGNDRLYIPKINANIAVVGGSDGTTVLQSGASQRSVDSGNPSEGGNYVLVASRLSLGYTPSETKQKSSFYHLGKLSSGDDIYVDYDGTRYAYKVELRKTVDDDTAALEVRSDKPRLTLYTAEAGSHDTVVAKQVGKIVWTSGKPKLQAIED